MHQLNLGMPVIGGNRNIPKFRVTFRRFHTHIFLSPRLCTIDRRYQRRFSVLDSRMDQTLHSDEASGTSNSIRAAPLLCFARQGPEGLFPVAIQVFWLSFCSSHIANSCGCFLAETDALTSSGSMKTQNANSTPQGLFVQEIMTVQGLASQQQCLQSIPKIKRIHRNTQMRPYRYIPPPRLKFTNNNIYHDMNLL